MSTELAILWIVLFIICIILVKLGKKVAGIAITLIIAYFLCQFIFPYLMNYL